MAKKTDNQLAEMLSAMNLDRAMAARVMFDHRHPQESPDYHARIDALWRSVHPQVVLEVFRGGAKTTKSEEFVTLDALFGTAWYQLLVGESYEKACQSLYNIKTELKTNEKIVAIFGPVEGDIWREHEIVLANGRKIQAVGQDQEQRGFKHGHHRPDRIIIDDVEKRTRIHDQKYRESVWTWIFSEIIPALDPVEGKVRAIGTSLWPSSLIARLRKDPHWVSLVVSICDNVTDFANPAWEARFSSDWIRRKYEEYAKAGQTVAFMREYMCVAMDEANRSFDTTKLVSLPEGPMYLPKLAAIDPARTVRDTSDRTGRAVGGWAGTKLYLYETGGARLRPDEIVAEAFRIDQQYQPIRVGVESNGLEEFLLQPLRGEMLRRRRVIPLQDLRAPGGKKGFILGLQPFVEAGEIVLIGGKEAHPDFVNEMEMYPGGTDDVLNAVAYLIVMRSGKPVYEDFSPDSIAAVDPEPRFPLVLAINQQGQMIAAALMQADGLGLSIFRDWVTYELPDDALAMIYAEIKLTYPGVKVRNFVPADLHEQWTQSPLVSSLRKKGELGSGGFIYNAIGACKNTLRLQVRGQPALLIDPQARWSVNAFAGGYSFEVSASGQPKDTPQENEYSVLMGAIESVVASLEQTSEAIDYNYAYTKDGRKYISTVSAR